jgi:PKD repeat protein
MDAGDTISINTRVQFDAGCSKDAAQYKWAMNDTSMGSINPSRFFRVAGSYSIILTVTNGNKTAETTKLLTVK